MRVRKYSSSKTELLPFTRLKSTGNEELVPLFAQRALLFHGRKSFVCSYTDRTTSLQFSDLFLFKSRPSSYSPRENEVVVIIHV